MEVFLQQLINGITLGSIYGLIAIGYTMVFGIIGMVNFAHGDVFMVAAFVALIAFLILTTWLGVSSIAVDPRDNKTYQTKTIISMDSPNQQRVTMYRDGGVLSKEIKVFEITYTRDTNPVWISPNPGNAYGTVPTDSNRSEP